VGGAERCLTNLVLRLNRSLFDPVVYSLWPRPAPEQSALVSKLETAGVPVRFVGLRSVWQIRSGVRQLNRFLKEQRPELIQTFLFHANVIGAYSGWRLKVPHVVQGMRVADRSAWRMMMERTTCRLVDRIVCVSQSVATFARDENGLPSDKLCVIPNGIETESISGASAADLSGLGIPADRRIIAVVGRLHAQKGVDWLLHLAPQILVTIPEVDFVLVGRGPEEESLRQLTESLGISHRIHFLGWRSDVPDILRRASLLALPSRWEGMPNVVLEAMAARLPIVATQVEGVAELLGPLAERQLVPYEDGVSFANRVTGFLQDSRLAQELGQLNAERVKSEFSLDRMVSSYERLYCELLGIASGSKN
jgi:glycosyltransferase involved in cell wall biosynthesis